MEDAELFDLDDADETRARRLHEESPFVDALVADTAFIDHEEYDDHLQQGGVDVGNFTIFADAPGFAAGIRRVVDVRRRVEAAADRFTLVRSVADLRATLDSDRVGVVLGTQGTGPVGEDLDLLDAFAYMGVRVFGLTYNTQNHFGSGCCERHDPGLSTLGVRAVERLNELGVVIDTSHDADRTLMDVVEASGQPVIQSHIGCRALCPSYARAKTDEQLAAVAAKGGVNAITPFPPVIKQDPETHRVLQATVHDVLDHIDHAVDVSGVDHVAFGADMSDRALDRGTLTAGSNLAVWRKTNPEVYGDGPTDRMDPYPTGLDRYPKLHNLTRGLVARGYDDEAVEKILGGNLCRVFETVWHD
jgi:membrane dipeptidase